MRQLYCDSGAFIITEAAVGCFEFPISGVELLGRAFADRCTSRGSPYGRCRRAASSGRFVSAIGRRISEMFNRSGHRGLQCGSLRHEPILVTEISVRIQLARQ